MSLSLQLKKEPVLPKPWGNTVGGIQGVPRILGLRRFSQNEDAGEEITTFVPDPYVPEGLKI